MKTKIFVLAMLAVLLLSPAVYAQTAEEWFTKGNAFRDSSKYKEAIECYNKAIVENPVYHEAWYNKGFCLFFSSKLDKEVMKDAINCFDKSIEIKSNHYISFFYKGLALEQLNRLEQTEDSTFNKIQLNDIVTAMATLALAILTGFYVVFTYRILKSNKKIIEENFRPNIFVDILAENSELYIFIKNIGNRAAFNLNIDITPDMDELVLQTDDKKIKWVDYKPILKQTYISPLFEQKFFLNWGQNFLKQKIQDKEYRFEFDISYVDESKVEFTHKYEINVDARIFEKKIVNYTHLHLIGEIEKHFKEFNKSVKDINKNLLKLIK